jgi:hypothetical protein
MSVTLRHHVGLEDFTVEQAVGMDRQGKPTYDSPIAGECWVVREQHVARNGRGEEVQALATMYVDGEFTPMPNENDRIVIGSEELVAIIVSRVDVKELQSGALDHVELHLRNE